MKNARQQHNMQRAEWCRDGKARSAYLSHAEICAQCSVRPGRPGCVLFGTDRGFYDAPETSGADAGNTPRGRGMRLRIVHVRKGSSGSVRGFASPAVMAWHNMLHEVIAELVKDGMSFDEANFKAGMAVGPMPKVKPSEAAQEQEGAPAEMGGRRTISPEDLEEVEAAAKHWSSMTPEYRDAKVAECLAACSPAAMPEDMADVTASKREIDMRRERREEMDAYRKRVSPAAMPEDMAARIAKRMRRAEWASRFMQRARAFGDGMAEAAMIVFRALWLAAVIALAVVAGVTLILFLPYVVLWLIY